MSNVFILVGILRRVRKLRHRLDEKLSVTIIRHKIKHSQRNWNILNVKNIAEYLLTCMSSDTILLRGIFSDDEYLVPH
jgi:hypothetical protein